MAPVVVGRALKTYLRSFGEFLIEKISSLQNPKLKAAMRLHSSRGRLAQNRFIIFGQRELGRAVANGFELLELFVSDELNQADCSTAINQFASDSTIVNQLSSECFSKLQYGERPDRMIGIATRTTSELDKLKIPKNPLVVICEAIEKPGNLGAIMRTADACGVDAVILSNALTDFFHPNTIRSSTGAVFGMQLAAATNEQVISWLAEHSFRVCPAIVDSATDVFEADLTGPVAIVMGNEAKGLSDYWKQQHFAGIKLPMQGIADSLNVSVTTAVILYEAVRQRRSGTGLSK